MARRHDWRLARFLAGHIAVGVAAGWTVLAGLLYFDIARLRTLTFDSPDGPLALVLLALFMAITFGSLAMGTGVMMLAGEKEE